MDFNDPNFKNRPYGTAPGCTANARTPYACARLSNATANRDVAVFDWSVVVSHPLIVITLSP